MHGVDMHGVDILSAYLRPDDPYVRERRIPFKIQDHTVYTGGMLV